jgi:hypothetical protein
MPKVLGALVIFDLQDMSGTEAAKNKAAYTREGRRQLLVILMFTLMRPSLKWEPRFIQDKISGSYAILI